MLQQVSGNCIGLAWLPFDEESITPDILGVSGVHMAHSLQLKAM